MAAPLLGRTPEFFMAMAGTSCPAEALRTAEAEVAARRASAVDWHRQGAHGIAVHMEWAADRLAESLPDLVRRFA